ncbi:MAG: 50S ribosomal protein L11 methyltransferase [Legionella sp.]|nr:MAG: 50S ribosomal protein L11 methyltransferase [Legionella sp.]
MWYQLKIEHCQSDEVEPISEELEEIGALSIMYTDKYDNPVLEPLPGTTPMWPEVIIQALFAQAAVAQQARDFLAHTKPALECSLEILPDKDWERSWMDDFKPQRFGKRLWICPTWLTPPEPQGINLMLDPGLAFGTGTHPTTSLCLTWLDHQDVTDKYVIDYGCGSGILSLAALKLGAAHVDAVDIDDQALQATKNNSLTNGISEEQLSISHPESLQVPVDLLIANILLDPLISLKYRFQQLLREDGQLVVSGILTEQAPLLIEAYESAFSHLAQEDHDGWALLVFKRK